MVAVARVINQRSVRLPSGCYGLSGAVTTML
jgi:hypothetical protein